MIAIRLKTEYLTNPIGIDITKPRLFWNCDGGISQTAYEIAATDSSGTSLWNSGKVHSSSMRCNWGGQPVPPETNVLWKVRLWDENDLCSDWSEASFETGIGTWQAKWITGNYSVNPYHRYPVDCFRKNFETDSIAKARLYITACGIYEAKINGQRCGNFVLAPGVTDYRKRIQYQTIDVTALLTYGKNELTIQLADGWYRGSTGAWGLRNQYGIRTKLLAQLEITHTDGSKQFVLTDASWEWSNDGPIRFADNKDGEIIDARMQPSYCGKAKLTHHAVIPTASNNVPVTEKEHFSPKMIHTPAGKTILDFGQNIAGFLSFRVTAHAGQQIALRFGEMLDASGEFTQKNIQLSKGKKTTPLQQVCYTCKDGLNEYKTTFAVFGFQYALVEADFEIDSTDFTSIAVYSDIAQTGFFHCSHALINRLVDATVWSAKSNHLDVPTDCPTRERHAWTGDAQIFFETAAYLFDFAAFSRKYLTDIYDWQRPSGKLPHIVPDGGADFYMHPMNGSVGWADIGILYPWNFSRYYHDNQILQAFYPRMARYARFMIRRCGKTMPVFGKRIPISKANRPYFVNDGQSYGEWAEPADVCAFQWTDFCAPHPEISTAYTAYMMALMTQIAEKLGHNTDAALFRKYRDGCKKAYQELASTPQFSLDTDRQARLVRPLAFRLLTDEQTIFAKKRLLQALENYRWRLGTGFLSTPLIMDVLTDIHTESAYRLLENEDTPGWLSMPKAGATTIWEAWEGPNSVSGGIGSLNHYSKGAVCRWIFDTMCGIRIDGENQFLISPHPGGSLTHASASYTSIYGKVESTWVRQDGQIQYTITVPSNCIAKIHLPDNSEHTQTAGTIVYYTEG